MAALAAQVPAIAIPADGVVFTGALGCHIAAGLTCVVTGALATTAAKRAGRHTVAGSVYFWSLAVVFARPRSWPCCGSARIGICC